MGAAQEAAYIHRMWEKLESLLEHPARYRFRPDLFPGCQIAAEGKHVILFRLNKSTLQVVRVLHGAMDFKRHLRPPL
jgi:toxin ParE1/3/4